MLQPLGERLNLVAEKRSVRERGRGTALWERALCGAWSSTRGLRKVCPTQLEEAPRKLQSTLQRAGEKPSPLKGKHTVLEKWRESGGAWKR